MKNHPRLIFVTGGVLSSLGKGVIASSLGALFQSQSLSVTLVKVDPYLNIDAGTMSPFQHGEVFVTDDGAECDLDMGNYERFLNLSLTANNHMTSGKIFSSVIEKERKGEYLGSTVQIVPHITDEIKNQLLNHCNNHDVVIVEIGGTVGDIESQPFLEVVRQLKYEFPYALCVHVTLLPYMEASDELKTKPTQHSVAQLRFAGITPDFIVARTQKKMLLDHKKKIGLFASLDPSTIFESPDVSSIYEIPYLLEKQGMTEAIMKRFSFVYKKSELLNLFKNKLTLRKSKKEIKLALVGKYSAMADAYKSVQEAILHASWDTQIEVHLDFICPDLMAAASQVKDCLSGYDGILMPGGFGHRSIENKILVTQYCREEKIPFFGICLGMQIAVIEYARNVLLWPQAHSCEFNDSTPQKIFHLSKHKKLSDFDQEKKGGTMRLGGQEVLLKKGSKIQTIYKKEKIRERHRHRYEFNHLYKDFFEENGMILSSLSEERNHYESIEISSHPWFIGTQFHPEFLSRPMKPHPLFISFLRAMAQKKYSKQKVYEEDICLSS